MRDPIGEIRHQHADYLTGSCRENRCGLSLNGFDANSIAIIHGSRYQKNNSYHQKLCDRIIFCQSQGCILSAVELKGGGKIRISDALEQIQNGLNIASTILRQFSVADWLPLLVYSGHMGPMETRLLRARTVEFRGQKKNVIKRNCNSQLKAILEA